MFFERTWYRFYILHTKYNFRTWYLRLDSALSYVYTIVIDNVIEKGEEEHYGRCGYVAEIGCRRER